MKNPMNGVSVLIRDNFFNFFFIIVIKNIFRLNLLQNGLKLGLMLIKPDLIQNLYLLINKMLVINNLNNFLINIL